MEIKKLMAKAGSYQGLRERALPENNSDSWNRGTIPTDHPIWDVWNSIRSAYPGPTANWEDSPPIEWAYALEGLSPRQIAEGLKRMVREGGEFPPSAGSFRDLCGGNDWEHARQSRPVEEVLALTEQASYRALDSDEMKSARALGTPETNPNYFKELMK